MSRVPTLPLLCLLALGLVLAAPSASAKDSITITMPKEAVQSNGTATGPINVNVAVNVDMGNCASGTSQAFTVTLDAKVDNVTGPGVSAEINPKTLKFDIPPGGSVSSAWKASQDATLVVKADGLQSPMDAKAVVTATASAVSCNVPLQQATFTEAAKGETAVKFKATGVANTNTGPVDEPVPGLEMPLLALAIVVVALVLRRK